MWVAKFKIKHDDWILSKTEKYRVSATGIPLNSYKKNGKQFSNGMVFLNGKQKEKEKFVASLKRDRRIRKLQVIGNQIFVLIEDEALIAPSMPDRLFFVQPVYFEKGYEYWELGSWDKETLTYFYNKIKKTAEVTIIKIQKENPAVFVQHAVPKLTAKQKKALELAIEFGYYNYPRAISVEELAKKIKIPRTTFQEHLRKGESKLMNLLVQSSK